MKANNTITVRQFLVCCCAFWAPWGPLIPLPFLPMVASRVFAAFAVLLIGYWALLLPHKLRPFPKSYNLLVLLIIVHTCVTYGYLHPDEFRFDMNTNAHIDELTHWVTQGRGVVVSRYFLNLFFAYALGAAIRTKRDVLLTSLALGIGFCTMMASSSRSSYHGEGIYRLTGGFLNPNNLGHTAMVVVFLSMLVLLMRGVDKLARGLATLSLLVALYGLIASASRSAMCALCIGFAMLLRYSSFSRKLRLIAVAGLAGACIALFLPEKAWHALAARLSVEEVVETRGSGRLDIAHDYLVQLPKYAGTGVGLMRAVEVTKETYTTWMLFHPHNAYLQYLVEFGFLGLLLFLFSLKQFWSGLAIPLQRGPPAMADVLMLGFFFGWTGLFLIGSGTSRIFFFSWGIIAAYRYMNMQKNCSKTHEEHRVYCDENRKEAQC